MQIYIGMHFVSWELAKAPCSYYAPFTICLVSAIRRLCMRTNKCRSNYPQRQPSIQGRVLGMPFRLRKHYIQLMFKFCLLSLSPSPLRMAALPATFLLWMTPNEPILSHSDCGCLQWRFPLRLQLSRLRLNMNTYLLIWTPFLYFLGQACLLSKDSLIYPSMQIDNCKPVHLFSLFLNTINLRERIYVVTEHRLPPS